MNNPTPASYSIEIVLCFLEGEGGKDTISIIMLNEEGNGCSLCLRFICDDNRRVFADYNLTTTSIVVYIGLR